MKFRNTPTFIRVATGSLAFAALTMFQAAAADTDKNKDLKHKDTTFIKHAVDGGMAEVELAQAGAQKAQNEQVKQLAQRIQADHTKANQELKQLAQRVGVTVPTEVDRKHRKMIDDLQSKSGAEFDKAFTEHMIKDHKKDIKQFEKAARDAENPEVKAFAERTLPTLREHLRMAQNAGRAIGLTGPLVTSTEEEDDAVGRSAAGTTGRSASDKSSSSKDEK
jgi:putative membrane protein